MKYILIAFSFLLFIACSSDDSPKDYTEENDQEIMAYLADNNLIAQKSNSGLYYIINNPGTGNNPIATDRVKVSYKGYFINGTIFDESADGISFNLQNVIRGWAEGITYFKEGGNGKLLIPSHLAYGSNGNGNIPGGSVLIFDIELIYVNYGTENEEQIQSYLMENELLATRSNTGLYYTINKQGEGKQPTITDNTTISYKGYFINGVLFDEGSDNISFNLENLIKGFSEGITYFKEGGNGTLYIPSHLAYGNNGTSAIPGGSVLIFDIGLISVN